MIFTPQIFGKTSVIMIRNFKCLIFRDQFKSFYAFLSLQFGKSDIKPLRKIQRPAELMVNALFGILEISIPENTGLRRELTNEVKLKIECN